MDFGDGVTVNWAVDRKNRDNGPKLTTLNSPRLQQEDHSNHGTASTSGDVQVTFIHPQGREMLAEMLNKKCKSVGDSSNSSGDIAILDSNVSIRHMLSTFENKENIPDNEEFPSLKDLDDPVFSTSLNEPIGPILKEAMETVVEPNVVKNPKNQELPATAKKDPDSPVFSTSLNEPIGPILKEAMETVVEPNIVKNPKKQQLPATTNLQHRQSISCGTKDSTKSTNKLVLESPRYRETHFGNNRNYSGTDSDIEVLAVEEMVDSDWSAGNTVTDKLNSSLQKVKISKNVKDSTDQEISLGNINSNSLSNSEQTGKDQLLIVISEQATYIKSLESTLGRYRETYKTLLKHVDILRLTLNEKNIEMGANGRDKPSERY